MAQLGTSPLLAQIRGNIYNNIPPATKFNLEPLRLQSGPASFDDRQTPMTYKDQKSTILAKIPTSLPDYDKIERVDDFNTADRKTVFDTNKDEKKIYDKSIVYKNAHQLRNTFGLSWADAVKRAWQNEKS